jgi:uncharacterized protein (TIGR02246 family)
MDKDEREIRDLVATWMSATKAGDLETVLGLMAEDVVFLLPGQPPMIGKEAFAAAARAAADQKPPRIDGTSEIQEIRVSGEWAFLWQKLSVIVEPAGDARPITRTGHTFSIFTKEDGRWVLARDANLLSPVRVPGE